MDGRAISDWGCEVKAESAYVQLRRDYGEKRNGAGDPIQNEKSKLKKQKAETVLDLVYSHF